MFPLRPNRGRGRGIKSVPHPSGVSQCFIAMTNPYDAEMLRLSVYYTSCRAPTEAEVQAMTFAQLVQARRDLQDLRKYGENLGYRVTILTQDRCPNPKSNKFEDC